MNSAARFPKNTLPAFSLFLAFCLSCASPAPPTGESAPLPRPRAGLSFDRVEAESPKHLTLWFNLEAENPRSKDARLAPSAWSALFNGKAIPPGSVFIVPEGPVAGGGKLAAPLRLDINTPDIDAKEFSEDTAGECKAELAFDLVFDYGGGETEKVPVKAAASFPLILEPEFRIISVAVKKAELIDTRFKVKIRLKNPNSFPVELSAFSFELYHVGSLWASGSRKNIMLIPPGQS
ncbi:MAG: hypothetical protein LBL20_00465, partial [Treponema sp.]|nr:hypothetical protein [Treponema sp.]